MRTALNTIAETLQGDLGCVGKAVELLEGSLPPEFQAKEIISQEQLDHYIEEAARAGGDEEGFGVEGCDLTKPVW